MYRPGRAAHVLSAWMPYIQDFGPNIGHDYGGRLMVTWLDK